MHCITSFKDNIIETENVSFTFDISGGVGAVYYRKMKEFSQNIAQIYAPTGQSETFGFLLQKCVRAAIELKNRGVKKGDYISLCSDHNLDVVVPIIAAYFVGAVPFPIEPTLEINDITHLLTLINPKIIFTIKSAKNKIEKSKSIVGRTSEIVVFGENFEREFLKAQDEENNFAPCYTKNLKETATVYFSSGSTGLPKGICISHYGMMAYYNKTMDKTADYQMVYNTANWYWVSSGMVLFMNTILGGARILATFDKSELWYWIEKYQITKLFLSGFDFLEFSISRKPEKIDVSSMRTILTGGSPTATEYLMSMRKMLPSTNIFQCYGMTEIGFVTMFETNNKLHENMSKEKPQSIGMPVHGVAYKVVDTETQETVGPNKSGELRVKTEKLMNGYHNMDSSDRFDKEGWFKTGDVVYYDEDFCFYFVNRIKDTLSYRGWWIYPSKLENILMTHPAVKVAVVVGKPHKVDEEHITAVVMLNDGYDNKVTPQELEKYLNDKIQDERQQLRGGVYIFKQMPVTATGKINRNQVKQLVCA